MPFCFPRSLFAGLPTPTLWSALLLVGVLCLQGCSLLTKADGKSGADSDADSTLAASTAPSFAVDVRAPDTVRETLERHLELQRFRNLPDLHANELQRLLGAADANARELLGTLGYFGPTITIELVETPDSKRAPRTVVVTVEPGTQTRIAKADINVAPSRAWPRPAAAGRRRFPPGWRGRHQWPWRCAGFPGIWRRRRRRQ